MVKVSTEINITNEEIAEIQKEYNFDLSPFQLKAISGISTKITGGLKLTKV